MGLIWPSIRLVGLLLRMMMKVFHDFYYNGRLPSSMNSTFISLVLKIDRSFKVPVFRPINLVTSIYKIISKVLLIRLGEVLGGMIFCGGKTNL